MSARQTPDDPPTPEFDAYTANYNEEINKALNFSGLDIDFFARVKNEYLVDILNARLDGAGKVKLLDVGCGVANAHKQLVGRVGELSGIDVSTASITSSAPTQSRHPLRGIRRHPRPLCRPLARRGFCRQCVSSRPGRAAIRPGRDIRRVLRPGGLFAIFEHNPFNPVTKHVVDTCEFDKDAVLLKRRDSEALLRASGFSDIKTRYIFAVPAAGRLLRRSRPPVFTAAPRSPVLYARYLPIEQLGSVEAYSACCARHAGGSRSPTTRSWPKSSRRLRRPPRTDHTM